MAGEPVTRSTLFSIASNSKLFTALAIGQLIGDGTVVPGSPNDTKLSWNTRVREILPGWKGRDQVLVDRATLQDVASMVLGLPDHTRALQARDPSYIPHILAQLPPSRDFRAEMQYNNMCYALLHHIVDVLSPPRSLARFVQDRFLEPLGMGQTTYNHTAAQATGRRAHNFAQVGRDPVACKDASWRTTSNGSAPLIPPKSCTGEARTTGWFLDEGDDGLHLAGWAGIVTSASDLAKWLRELLEAQILSRSSITSARTARSIYDGRPPRHFELGPELYGQGQVITSYRGHQVAFHSGRMSGHRSIVLRLPDQDIGVAVMTNGGFCSYEVAQTIARRVMDERLELEAIDWEGRLARSVRKHEAGQVYTLPPDLAALPARLSSIPGRYQSPGYGVLDIVPLDPRSDAHAIWTKDLPNTIRGASANATFIGRLHDSLLLPNIVFTHFDGNLVNFTAPVYAQATDEGGSERFNAWTSQGQAVFDGGRLGLASNFIQVYPDYQYEGADTTGDEGDETGVDVWFVKMDEAG